MALFGLTVTAKTEQNGFVLKIREGKKKQVLCWEEARNEKDEEEQQQQQ